MSTTSITCFTYVRNYSHYITVHYITCSTQQRVGTPFKRQRGAQKGITNAEVPTVTVIQQVGGR
jgi:hypothetical protein